MRYELSYQEASCGTYKFVWIALLVCFLRIHPAVANSDESPIISKDAGNDPQTDLYMPKRDWNHNLKMWGKRGWSNIHGGWGLKRNIPGDSAEDQDEYQSPPEKRGWNNLRSEWGKRFAPLEEEFQQQSFIDQGTEDPRYTAYNNYDSSSDSKDEAKRSWREMSDGWGKRSRWGQFRGAWGKREPSWSNLKGIWG